MCIEELCKAKEEASFKTQDSVIISVLTPVEFLYILVVVLAFRFVEFFTPVASVKWPLKMSVAKRSLFSD